jgi:hypothetical protein
MLVLESYGIKKTNFSSNDDITGMFLGIFTDVIFSNGTVARNWSDIKNDQRSMIDFYDGEYHNRFSLKE